MLGYTLRKIDHTPDLLNRLIHPDDLPAYEAHCAQIRDGKRDRFQIEFHAKTKSGEWRWILVRGKIVTRAPDGRALRMPIYADQILHVGPIGFGWLRAAPSIGAFAMPMWIAHRPPLPSPGRALLWAVAGFGAAIVVFGLSHWFWLSFLALIFSGAFDNISVVVRQSLVQLATPDYLRGRVTAMNQIFIGSSNEIGALRAGLMSALIGPVAAVVWGGLGTILVTITVARAVPALHRLPPLHTLRPEE